MSVEELKVVLRRSEQSGFGFSLLGTTGPPHVIYDIHEHSPAAECGVKAGDIILKVNGTDVHRHTTKEVLKRLRLSDDLVTLELKRDPKLKARLKEQLTNAKSPHYEDIESPHIYDYKTSFGDNQSPTHTHHHREGGDSPLHDAHRSNTSSSNIGGSATSPAIRYAKSPTHLPPTTHRQNVSSSGNHSRSSSGSSAKIQIGDTAGNASTAATPANAASTSPTCRPSRIPTALKSAQKAPVQHSPQNKRPRPSQIPTKAGPVSANGTTATTSSVGGGASLQHSNSYSGSGQRFQQHPPAEVDPEPNSAPPQPAKAPRFEAYMMTGEVILNLSRTSQITHNTNLLPGPVKKIDSLRDSPQRSGIAARANGALAPRASGESSPTSSSSVESPTHTGSTDSAHLHKPHLKREQGKQRHQHHLLQQQFDSFNNSYNNSNSGGVGGGSGADDRRKDDTLLLCEELERDDDDEAEEEEIDNSDSEYDLEQRVANRRQRQGHKERQQEKRHRRHQHYQHPDEVDIEDEENEEDQTNYDITNIETYNSGGDVDGVDEEASDQQCLVMQYGDEETVDECMQADERAAQKRRLRLMKQKGNANSNAAPAPGDGCDTLDCSRPYYEAHYHQHHHHHHHHRHQHQHQRQHGSGGSSSSSATVKSDGIGAGANSSPDETSFSVPTSPISLSTPLIDKDTANSVPTSPEPSSLGAVGGGCGGGVSAGPHGDGAVVRRHNGVVRTCDSAGFRTSKSEDHLQQIQREGMAAVIPIDIDEDVNSSLNTLLDTRHDSEDSQSSASANTVTAATTITKKHTATPIAAASGFSRGGGSRHSSPEFTLLSQRDIFNRRRRKVRISVPRIILQAPPSVTTDSASLTQLNNDNNNSSNTITATVNSVSTVAETQQQIDAPLLFTNKGSSRERIVWTYNAPLAPHQLQQQQQHQHYGGGVGGGHNNSSPNSHSHSHSHSHSSSISSSPQHSAGSPASPTSVSSSVMSSSGSKGALGIGGGYALSSNNGHHTQQQHQQQGQNMMNGQNMTNSGGTATGTGTTTATGITMGLLQCPNNTGGGIVGGGGCCSSSGVVGGDQSVSEAISNISSPDYQDEDNLLSSRDLVGGMVLSDPSDSDSTILVSDAAAQRQHQQHQQQNEQQQQHKLVIQVRGVDNSSNGGGGGSSPRSAYAEFKDSEDELATLTEEAPNTIVGGTNAVDGGRDSSPPVSDDGSDVESLHSYHYSPKAVDMPSAIRLAKRLYSLDGFKKSDVSRHLSKNNDFSRAVADEYLKHFTFEKKTLDQSLREFLQQFSLSGETQERERVLVHFSKRFLDCNPGTFNSQDAVHTLTCAIMLLNTDLHGHNIGRKMTCAEFIENLAEMNDGQNFPKDVLKYLYQAIKTQPLEWALDDDAADMQKQRGDNNVSGASSSGQLGQNPFLDLPESSTAIEYKKGYVMRKCCYDSNYKKTPFGKRSWKMFYCTLRDLVLFLHKDEHGFRKSQMSDNLHNAIRIHHALATKATDYTKKQHVFRLQTADQAEYLFQTSDSKELQSWVETINFVCAAYSAPPLEGGVGSQKRFQRPLLPSTHTKLLMRAQLESHEQQLSQLEAALAEHKKGPIPNKGLPQQNYKEKEAYLQYEIRRYRAYVSILSAKLLADQQQLELQQQQQQLSANTEEGDTFPMGAAAVGIRQQQQIQLQQPLPQSQMQQQTQQPTATAQHAPPQQQQSANRWLCGCAWWSLLFCKTF